MQNRDDIIILVAKCKKTIPRGQRNISHYAGLAFPEFSKSKIENLIQAKQTDADFTFWLKNFSKNAIKADKILKNS